MPRGSGGTRRRSHRFQSGWRVTRSHRLAKLAQMSWPREPAAVISQLAPRRPRLAGRAACPWPTGIPPYPAPTAVPGPVGSLLPHLALLCVRPTALCSPATPALIPPPPPPPPPPSPTSLASPLQHTPARFRDGDRLRVGPRLRRRAHLYRRR
jgi:hypothetical protein